MNAIKYSRVDIDGFGVAYRESGPAYKYQSSDTGRL
jgi:hypothetical protein